MYMMLAHGTISAMLFMVVGVIYDRAHHRDLDRFGGLAWIMPKYSVLASFAFFASLGLPGMSGFIAEITTFVGAFASEIQGFQLFALDLAARRRDHRGLLPDHPPEGLPRRHARGLQGREALPRRDGA